MNSDDKLYLSQIRDCCAKIRRYTSVGREAFLASDLHQDAVIRNFEIIGEASKRLSSELKDSGSLPWREMTAFRNFPIHQYMGVELRLVWEVVEQDLSPVEQAIKSLLTP